MRFKQYFVLVMLVLLAACTVKTQMPLKPGLEPAPTQLDIPFTRQSGPSCVPSQVTMALNYYFPERSYTLEQVDNMIGRKGDYWTWFSQAIPILVNEGLDAHYYSTTPYFELNPEFVLRYYGQQDGTLINSVTDWPELNKSIEYLNQHPERYTQTKLFWSEVENAFNQGSIIIMIIDQNTLSHNPGIYAGHGVTITFINETHVKFHNSNSGPNQVALKDDFVAAWNAKGTDNDVILVRGKV